MSDQWLEIFLSLLRMRADELSRAGGEDGPRGIDFRDRHYRWCKNEANRIWAILNEE